MSRLLNCALALSVALLMTVPGALAAPTRESSRSEVQVGLVELHSLDPVAPNYAEATKWLGSGPRTDDQLRAMYPAFDSYPEHAKIALRKAPDPNIADMLTKLDMTDVKAKFTELQTNFSLPNRLTGTQNYQKATDWIKGVIAAKAPNLIVTYQTWSSYRNVVIELKGDGSTTDRYEVGGHYDSVSAGPGMDDDGSGSLGSALIAIAMAGYKFKADIRFLLFDAEESGLIGSQHYVNLEKQNSAPIKYYINMDMMAYDPNNQGKVNANTAKTYLQDLHQTVTTDYSVGLGINRGGQQSCNTDHCYYDRNGYDSVSDDEVTFSACYHKACDKVDQFNWDTMLKIFKVVAGSLATSAGMLGKGNQSQATRIDVTPKNPSIDTTQTKQFDAKGYDAGGSPAPLPGPVTWTASGGTISPTGLYTPSAAGTFTVTAKSGALQDLTNITVTNPAGGLTSIKVTPQNGTMKEHLTQQFAAIGCDAQGNCNLPLPGGAPDVWTVTGGGTKAVITQASGSDPGGLFTPDGAATYTIEAKKGAIVGKTNIVVEKLTLTSLTVSAGCTTECEVGVEYPITASGQDATGTIQFSNAKHGAQFTWTITAVKPVGGNFGVVMENKPDWYYIPTILGTAKVKATGYGTASNEIEITIVPSTLASVLLDPAADQSKKGGETVAFKVSKAIDSHNNSFLPDYASRLTFKWTVNPSTMGDIAAGTDPWTATFTAKKKGSGTVLVEVTDSKGQVKKSDSTKVTVTSDATGGPPPPPPNGTSSSGMDLGALMIPLLLIIVIVVAAIAAMAVMGAKKRKQKQQQQGYWQQQQGYGQPGQQGWDQNQQQWPPQ